jgi:predicted CoA-substrate-specific enzyme activase
MVLIDDQKRIALSYYTPNNGDPLYAVKKGLDHFYEVCRTAGVMPQIVRTAVTGYGEGLIKTAFEIDDGVVETMAHYRAAKHFNEKVSFVLDIGGQDMKAIFVNNGFVSDIQINEACSSGCGSFIETLAHSLGYDVTEFSALACKSNAPYDLGTRCTVFMNSKIKQALREGISICDIAAGLAYSVIKNSLHKVLKLNDTKVLGDVIVTQGGTFKNHAVLRCLELVLGKEVIRADISELMGAYGAALTARYNYMHMRDQTQTSEFKGLKTDNGGMILNSETLSCKGCENRCRVTKLQFNNGHHYFHGNRCEQHFSNGEVSERAGKNLVKLKEKKLFDRSMDPEGTPILTFGIPRVLNIYENFPFWCTFLVSCGFKVVVSDPSSMRMFEKGVGTIMSDNICLPAKVAHGHIFNLVEKRVDRIFYPMVVFEQKEDKHVQNSYNCPVITGYPDVVRSAVELVSEYGIPIDRPAVDFRNLSLLRQQLYHFVKPFGVDRKNVNKALCLALKAHKEFKKAIQDDAKKVIEEAKRTDSTVFVLAGRPYHIDPFIHHGIPSLLAQLGVDVIPEDAIPFDEKYALNDCNMLTQWAYANRILNAAKYVGRNQKMQMVQITSFGCGLDAVSSDEAKEVLSRAGKIYALIKMDEIAHLGATKIRLRTMLEAIKERPPFERRQENSCDIKLCHPCGLLPTKKKTEMTIIVPWISPHYSPCISFSFNALGYKVESLLPQDRSSVDVGLKHVNNDMCYPAIIIIGDIIKALQSGKYDPKYTAIMLSQTFGQCRASNYVPLTKKALVRAGFGDVPVLSISADDTDVTAGFNIDKKGLVKRLALGVIFSDAVARMYYATASREINSGDSAQIQKRCMAKMEHLFGESNFKCFLKMLKCAVHEFNGVKVMDASIPLIGIVGEIFVKHNSFANSNIVEWLMSQGVEVVMPSLPAFFTQRFVNEEFNQRVYLRRSFKDRILNKIMERYTNYYLLQVDDVLKNFKYYRKDRGIKTLALSASRAVSLANQAGEGWLLTAEIMAMLESGISNIICLQPFGCLANHITGKGIERRVKKLYPEAKILFLDMDAGASEVNHFNRLYFMLMMAKEGLPKEAKTCCVH